jgi:hypothetical protein
MTRKKHEIEYPKLNAKHIVGDNQKEVSGGMIFSGMETLVKTTTQSTV